MRRYNMARHKGNARFTVTLNQLDQGNIMKKRIVEVFNLASGKVYTYCMPRDILGDTGKEATFRRECLTSTHMLENNLASSLHNESARARVGKTIECGQRSIGIGDLATLSSQ